MTVAYSPDLSRRLFTTTPRSFKSKQENESVSDSECQKFDPTQKQKIETQTQKIPYL